MSTGELNNYNNGHPIVLELGMFKIQVGLNSRDLKEADPELK